MTELNELIERHLGAEILSSCALGGGYNSRVLRLDLRDRRRVVAKRYAERGPDRLDPLGVENQALTFFARHCVEGVPRLLATDRASRWAVLSEVAGRSVPSPDIEERDVRSLLAFLGLLDGLGQASDAPELPAASEASFSLEGLRRDIDGRLRGLQEAAVGDRTRLLLPFLREYVRPALDLFYGEAAQYLDRAGLDASSELPTEHRRLSPSDFGFHNALRDDGDRWSFVDFEYFGWDDPAKTISDLLLHPRSGLPSSLRSFFVAERLAALPHDVTLPHRLRAGYPLFGLKWCLILLNEFVPRDLERRRAAGHDGGDPRAEQLRKATVLLEQLHRDRNPLPSDD